MLASLFDELLTDCGFLEGSENHSPCHDWLSSETFNVSWGKHPSKRTVTELRFYQPIENKFFLVCFKIIRHSR